MRYFLKKTTPSKKGTYIQIYQSAYIPGKGGRNKSYKAIGYVFDLIAKGIKDPIKYAQELVDELNESLGPSREAKIGDAEYSLNLGHFIIKSMLDYLEPDEMLNLMSINKRFSFNLSNFVRSMIYAQIINPASKHKAFERVIPGIYGAETFSYDQILDTVNYIGGDYQKYIELFNLQIAKKWKRHTSNLLFDCTNYYFEVDFPKDERQYGPSKEERHLPIIGQALLLDEDQIPIGMSMYTGNQSEKPELRKNIENLKERFDIKGRVVQIADKGLNCAKNIYSAVKEANDGYIFSKSVHGKSLPKLEKDWILLEDNEFNVWHDVCDSKGNLCYRYKEWVDVFDYSFTDDNGDKITFKTKEKRVVTYTPSLARKQRIQIEKQIEKAKNMTTIRQVCKEDYGDSIKYVKFITNDKEGNKITPVPMMNEDKIREDLAYAGYNLLVTSEWKKKATEIYSAYHSLWRIEESFRVMKTYLEARPVYLQKIDSIYGHFTICYLALTILRLLELKVFNDELSIGQIVDFIRDYNITKTMDGNYVNTAHTSEALVAIKKRFALAKLDNLNLNKKSADNILNAELYFD